MTRLFCLCLLSLSLLALPAAEAQSRRELAERLDAAEVRLGELESRFMAGDPVADALMRRLDELDYQVRQLTGETERLGFENRQLREEIDRLRQAAPRAAAQSGEPQSGESSPGDSPSGETPSGPAGTLDDETVAWMREGLDEDTAQDDGDADTDDAFDPDARFAEDRAAATGVLGSPASIAPERPARSADPDHLYDSARAQLLDGDFDGAQDGFEHFVVEHPDHERAGEAWYWLGETFFVRSDLGEAAEAYIASLRAAPQGPKAPDALVRLAASLNGLGRQSDACATLGRFGSQFPNASQDSRQRADREAQRARCS